MRILTPALLAPALAALVAAPLLAFALPASAQNFDTPELTQTPSDDEPMNELDMWFQQLASSQNEMAAQIADGHIQQLWLKSGSDTVDLLMTWAMQAMTEKDYPMALDLLDNVTTMKPDFAEGWNKRATIEYLQDDYTDAIADIAHVLSIEPRHYGALSGLGMIFKDMDQNERALDALKRALALRPYLTNVAELIKDLEHKVGQDL